MIKKVKTTWTVNSNKKSSSSLEETKVLNSYTNKKKSIHSKKMFKEKL